MPGIDYAALKNAYTVDQVLQAVWAIHAVRRDGKGRHGRCPMCGRSPRSDTLSWTDRVWFCHRCCLGGSILDLYARAYGLQLHDAAAELARRMGGRPPWLPRQPRVEKPRNREEAP